MRQEDEGNKPLTTRQIVNTWWPLAASWLLMAVELPVVSAVIARLPNPAINLAAWGGIVFPFSLLIEAPIIMLLAASTALSKDWKSYLQIRRFMIVAGASLTFLHFLIAFTPIYDILIVGLMDPPPEIIEPGRIGLRLMLPWTWAIAYRRFNQGTLIRFGHSEVVGLGTVVRLLADGVVLAVGLAIGTIPGIVVASTSIAIAVMCEAFYTGIRMRPVLRDEVRPAPEVEPPLTLRSFLEFYTPLALTSLLTLLVLPLGSAAVSRMPQPLASLAVWPVLSGFLFILRSLGVAYNETVLALLDEPNAYRRLRSFAIGLAIGVTLFLILVGGTPISNFYFEKISALPNELAELAINAIWFAFPVPAISVFISLLQGVVIHSRKTRGVTESVVVFLLVAGAILVMGIYFATMPGVYVGWIAFSAGFICQALYLWIRGQGAIKVLRARSAPVAPV